MKKITEYYLFIYYLVKSQMPVVTIGGCMPPGLVISISLKLRLIFLRKLPKCHEIGETSVDRLTNPGKSKEN